MNLWIVTIGSSDVQLDSDKVNQEKGRTEKDRSDKVWSYWYTEELKAECHDVDFVPKALFKDKEEPYRIAPRILGKVYNAGSKKFQEEIWSYLTFPLLDNFVQKMKDYPTLDAIAVLLTDQSIVFQDERQQRRPKSPYWQDTCELRPILQRYFQDRFPSILCEWVTLQPISVEQSLDNWNSVLELVREKFHNLTVAGKEIATTSRDNIYVSHQAGTPAISSAVQFISLATFRENVQFLVSNEVTQQVLPIPQSTYLREIRRQEAKILLDRHDYSGVEALIEAYLDDDTQILLNAAIQWNFAKFDEFAKELQTLSNQELQKLADDVEERSKHWWWAAYEAAYLAIIRLEQGNIVEAFFHSFRAIEGAFSDWGKHTFENYIKKENDRAYLQPSVLEASEKYFEGVTFKADGTPKNKLAELQKKILDLAEQLKSIKNADQKSNKNQKPKRILLAGGDLYILFRSQKPDYESCDFNRFWNSEDGIGEKRNKNFHQLQGLSEANLLEDWEVSNREDWEKRILKYLNFIAKEDLSQEFKSLEKASLMVKVHQELEKAIAQL